MTPFRTRFAPSPTGYLHLGHAFSALLAHDLAKAAGGRFALRIEDTDRARCRREYERAILDDLEWLGLRWDGPVLRQSERTPHYLAALAELSARGLVFPCSCNRRAIRDALSAPQEGAAQTGPDGPVYPGTCRDRPMSDRRTGDALRLNMQRAVATLSRPLCWREEGSGVARDVAVSRTDLIERTGDVVLGRRETGHIAYHLAVVVDDAAQGISHVMRGADLFEATRIHVVLQGLLGLPGPVCHHHRLIRDEAGKRLAKRDDARAIRTYRAEGATPADIRRMVGL